MRTWFIKMGALLALAASLTGCGYNQFQQLDEQTKSAWSEVVNQYQRRADLIDNLVTVEDLPAKIARLSTRLWTKLKTNT